MAESPPSTRRRDSKFPAFPRAPYFFGDGGDKGAGQLPKRRVVQVTTGQVNLIDGTASGPVQLTQASGGWLLSVRSKHNCWLRLYATEADRAADKTRNRGDKVPDTQNIILDCELEAAGVPGPLTRHWGVLTDCLNHELFGLAIDADDTTFWQSGKSNIEVGDIFSLDMGLLTKFGSFRIEIPSASFSNIPAKVRMEASRTGARWDTLIENQAFSYVTDFLLTSEVEYRFVRFTVTEVDPDHHGGAWYIGEVNAYPFSGYDRVLLLTDADVQGVQFFNMDDPAQAQIYYQMVMDDPLDASSLFNATGFQNSICKIRGHTTDGAGHVIWGPYERDCNNCELLKFWPQPVGLGVWHDPGGYRPRFYQQCGKLFAYGVSRSGADGVGILKVVELPKTMEAAAFSMSAIRATLVDTTAFWAYACFYLNDQANWDTSPYLWAGVTRESVDTVQLVIGWRDASGVYHNLATYPSVSCHLGSTIGFTATIGTNDDGDFVARVAVDDTRRVEAIVPADLIALEHHRAVGLDLSSAAPPDAPLAYGGLALTGLRIAGGLGTTTFDVGFIPEESPGGTIKRV